MKPSQTIVRIVVAAWCLLLASGPVARAVAAVPEDDPFGPDDVSAETQEPASSAATENARLLPWGDGLAEGRRVALAEGKPLLVRVGADWCAVCREEETEIEQPAAQKALADWTLAYVDLTLPSDEGEQLGVSVVPTWRLATALGVEVATHEGFLSAEQLVEWLAEHRAEALAVPPAVLLRSGPPSAADVSKLVEQFSDQSALVREAAIRRLLPYPKQSGPRVIEAFGEGPLSVRLAAMELLEPWGAPLMDIDPWAPETITPERLAALEQWGQSPPEEPPAVPEQLDAQQLKEVNRQIERMVKGTEIEAAAVREQLAGLGAALMPEIYDRLKNATTDQQRSRLLAMRYRLVAGDSLVLRWPGGIVQLASGDFRERQRAAEQLATLAGQEDQALLLELFSDPDPLVRETSLRGLQNIGGEEATGALVKLLADPEPNVRAAVLKQLEESPQPGMVAKVAEYLKTEPDPDLVVHAIRFLRSVDDEAAAWAMLPLLKHESWQVRAEAAAGLAGAAYSEEEISSSYVVDEHGDIIRTFMEEMPGDAETEPETEEESQLSLAEQVQAGLIALLDDPEPFVVSRAIEAMPRLTEQGVEPLIAVAERHPELLPTVMEMLAYQADEIEEITPLLREYATNESSEVRRTALHGLYQASRDDVEWVVRTGLGDTDSMVRATSAQILFQFLDRQRTTQYSILDSAREREMFGIEFSSTPRPSLMSQALSFLGMGKSAADETETEPEPEEAPADETPEEEPKEPEEPPSVFDKWLLAYRQGTGRPSWTNEMVEPLEEMLASELLEERGTAAMALVAMGKIEQGLPVILEEARKNPDAVSAIAQVLPWLIWPERLDVLTEAQSLIEADMLPSLIYSLRETPDRRMTDFLWEMLGKEDISGRVADTLHDALLAAYTGERYASWYNVTPEVSQELAEAARPQLAEGGRWQRLVALLILMHAEPEEAAVAAAKIADDPEEDAALREDASIIKLSMGTTDERVRAAIDTLGHESPKRREMALNYLVLGSSANRYVGDGDISLDMASSDNFLDEYSSGAPIIPAAPPGLKPEHVRPLLDDPDPETAAYAGYLLAVMQDPAGLPPLLNYWRKNRVNDYYVDDLMFRAIARLDAGDQLPVLEEIYAELDEYDVPNFYWTVRIMSGDEILAFRQEIRDKVGMENLQ